MKMKKIFLSLLALLVTATANVQADDLVSGEYYRICSLDGLSAMSNGGSTANNTILNMQALDESDEGQVWQLTQSSGYWQIKSSCGDVCADNPSESHSKWSDQLLQWKTSGGNNQKWTFLEADNGTFYMIPYESSNKSKGYGYDDSGRLTYQTKGADNTRFILKRVQSSALPTASVEGYYALQSVSTYPDYIYKSEGRFLTFSSSGSPSLADGYTHENSRLYISPDAEGHLRITLPQRGKYVYATSSSLRLSDESDESHADAAAFAIYLDTESLTLQSRVCLHIGTDSATNAKSSLKVLYPGTNGSSVTVKSNEVGSSYVFRLVALPAGSESDRLASIISEATSALELGLSEETQATLKAAIAAAQDELDYPYLTTSDVSKAVDALQTAIDAAKGSAATAPDRATAISPIDSKAAPTVKVGNGRISVSGASSVLLYDAAGRSVNATADRLPKGVYIVVADGRSFRVML